MKRLSMMLVMALAMSLTTGTRAQEKIENPFITAKVGEWASYKLISAQLPQGLEVKQIITKKDADEVTLKIEMKMGERDLPPQEQKISLKEPFDPVKLMQKQGVKGEITKGKSGEETVEIGGKKYKCKWEESEISAEVSGQKVQSKIKTWTSKEIPLGGMVKMETEMEVGTMKNKMVMELIGTGQETEKK